MIEMVFSHKLFNPLFWHIRKAMHDKNIRYIINRGGSSSGKSVSTTQAVLLSVFSSTASVLSVLSEFPVSSPPNRSLKNPTILSQRPSSFA